MINSRAALRVAVVEDQPLFREMLLTLLRAQPEVDVVASADSLAGARRVIDPRAVDVALLDVELPDGNGIELGVELRKADAGIGIVLLSAQDVMVSLLSLPTMTRQGWSYLSKTSTTSTGALMRALRTSADGRTMLDPDLVRASQPRAGSSLAALTERQLAALRLLASGLSNTAIAAELNITTHSVENLLNAMYTNLGVSAEGSRNRRVSAVLRLLEESGRPSATL